MGDAQPIHRSPRRIAYQLRDDVKKEIKKLLVVYIGPGHATTKHRG